MLRLTDIAHLIVRSRLSAGGVAIDATVGNGHDTVVLADTVGAAGLVFGFDIQADALQRARVLIGQRSNVILKLAGHETLAQNVPSDLHGAVTAAMFNLGYLPGADKAVTTRPETTTVALSQATSLIAVGGVITLVMYPGHAGGAEEVAALSAFLDTLPPDFAAHRTARLNGPSTAPALVWVERLR